MKWRLVYTRQAKRDAKKLARSDLRVQAEKVLDILANDPYQTPPPFERLVGALSGACSRRINIQHRVVYQLLDDNRIVKVIRLWTHYE